MKDKIKEHMEVLGSDGEHVGTVDRCEGSTIKLTKNDPKAGGEHHIIPMAWVKRVDSQVHLSRTCGDAMQDWKSVA